MAQEALTSPSFFLGGEIMAKILHMADMHLDSAFTARLSPDLAQLRRSEQRAVFSRIIDMAHESADVLLIAGDLFDSLNVSDETVSFMKRKFTEISEIPVFIAAGNHDPYTPNSVYANYDFGENVRVFDPAGEYFDLDDLHIRICGASFGSEDGSGVQSICDMPKHDKYKNIAVVHGDAVYGKSGKIGYNPISVSEIENSGFDYVALGHVHTFSGFKKAGKTFWAYPGIPEPRGFDESAEKGGYGVICLEAFDKFSFEFIETHKRLYHVINIELDENITDSEMIIELISERLGEFSQNDLFKIVISGQTAENFRPNIELIYNRVKELSFFVTVENNTEVFRNLNADENDNSIRAVYIRMLNEKIANAVSEEDRSIAEEALKYGIDALDGRLK